MLKKIPKQYERQKSFLKTSAKAVVAAEVALFFASYYVYHKMNTSRGKAIMEYACEAI